MCGLHHNSEEISVYAHIVALVDGISNANLNLYRNDRLFDDPKVKKEVAESACPSDIFYFGTLLTDRQHIRQLKMPTNEAQVDGYLAPGEKNGKNGTLTVLGCGAYVFAQSLF